MMAKDQHNAGSQKMRLLCIDGGGIKGTCPAAFLASLEDDLGPVEIQGFHLR